MHGVRCAVCGAQKGETNRWWVLFQADSYQTVLLGRMEEAETLQQWRNQTVRFHLCGEQCLYRKLSAILVRGTDGGVNGRHPLPPSSPQTAPTRSSRMRMLLSPDFKMAREITHGCLHQREGPFNEFWGSATICNERCTVQSHLR